MMDVMEANIAGKPLQNPGQLIERTALQAGSQEIPLVMALPVRPIEIVLDIE